MQHSIGWVSAGIFLIVPLYFMLRFRLVGLLVSVFLLWVLFGLLSEFFPLSRPGWEPFHNPFSFILGLTCYLTPFLVIYVLKELLLALLKKARKS